MSSSKSGGVWVTLISIYIYILIQCVDQKKCSGNDHFNAIRNFIEFWCDEEEINKF